MGNHKHTAMVETNMVRYSVKNACTLYNKPGVLKSGCEWGPYDAMGCG